MITAWKFSLGQCINGGHCYLLNLFLCREALFNNSITHVTVHPQRWADKPLPWFKELLGQNIKNVAKVLLKNQVT